MADRTSAISLDSSTAVATSGIVFSYNGFQSPVNLAGEVRKPGRSVPIAIFGSIALSAVVYLLLQWPSLGAVAPEHLRDGLGRAGIQFALRAAGPGTELNWLDTLYADAFVSPSGTGSTYTATTARMIYAMERSGTVPEAFEPRAPAPGDTASAECRNLLGVLISHQRLKTSPTRIPRRGARAEGLRHRTAALHGVRSCVPWSRCSACPSRWG